LDSVAALVQVRVTVPRRTSKSLEVAHVKTRTVAILLGLVISALSAVANSLESQQSSPGVGATSLVPRDATALCVDGSWSSAANRRGACSAHGGMKEWFGKAPKAATARCKDGTYSQAADLQGACSKHGGVAFRLKDSKAKS